MPSIVVNGVARALPPHASIADLVRELALEGRKIAVEKNGEIVPRSLHGETRIAEDDRIEIVAAVGGG